jgi:acetyltransferase-like isoleucine patch superfamily enzyme/dTDP-4-dehydrorhamnose 3,5-epimerase-like enzyme
MSRDAATMREARRPDATGAHFTHPAGICEASDVGAGTRIWAFAHVLPGARIGSECNICDHVFIENDVVIGDRVTVKCGVAIWDGIRIEEDVFIGPDVTFTNDAFPRSRVLRRELPPTVVRRGASLGANCTILPGLTIGICAMVGAGSVLTHDVPPYAIVVGNPARIVGYVDAHDVGQLHVTRAEMPADEDPRALRVAGATLFRLLRVDDLRGSLVSGEVDGQLPFQPRRFFSVMHVPSKDVRGAHAHRTCAQFLVCQAGSVAVVIDDGHVREEVVLADPQYGLYVPPMVWSVQYRYTHDAVLLVLASDRYAPEDYIRNYDEFLEQVAEPNATSADRTARQSAADSSAERFS